MSNFVHLHVHTDHSFLDGCVKIPNLIRQAKELGMPAIAMTDHANICGAIDFYSDAKREGIKPIVGLEAYYINDYKMGERPKREFNDNIMFETEPSMFSPKDYPKYQIHHKTLLAQNYEGYLNLAKLTTESYSRGYFRRPCIDFETLAKYSNGVIALSGCINGVASQYLLYSDYKKAREVTANFLDVFGRDRYFIELQNHGLVEEKKIIPGLIKLAREFKLKLVATNDCHYILRGNADVHDAMLCIQTGSKLKDENRIRYPNNEFYLKTRKEMEQAFPDLPEALDNTLLIADMCDLQIKIGENHYPKFEQTIEITFDSDESNFNKILDLYVVKKNEILVRQGEEANFSLGKEKRNVLMKNGLLLFDLSKKGMFKRYGVDYDHPEKYIPKDKEPAYYAQTLCDKLDFELSIIIGEGLADYFLIDWDIINWARNNGILVGSGRGSVAGCMITYLLKITDVDPIRFNLQFERMLSLERVSPPGFAIDFCQNRRNEVIEYIRQKYGADRVSNIITFCKFSAKQAMRDTMRVNDVPFERTMKIARMISEGLKMTINKALEMSTEFRDKYGHDQVIEKSVEQAKVLEGMIRQTGNHSTGIIIGDQRLGDIMPMMIQENNLTTQFPKSTLEYLGFLKLDLIASEELEIVSEIQGKIRKTYNLPDFNIEEISLDDSLTYKLFSSGETRRIFQFESEEIQKFCREIEVSSFEEIVALIALYRPISMQFIYRYINGKKNPSKINVPHPFLRDLLQETHGVLVYKEQVMSAIQIVAGYTLGEADIMRRAMGKKNVDIMNKQKTLFVERAKIFNNINEKDASEIFIFLEKYSQYAFNKSHAVAFAMLSYRMAYLKANYPTEFMSAILKI